MNGYGGGERRRRKGASFAEKRMKRVEVQARMWCFGTRGTEMYNRGKTDVLARRGVNEK